MAKILAPAKTPGVAVARVLRGLGLKQGLDFGVRAERKNGERIGTRVAVFGQQANQTVADNADAIERATADAGFHFNVSVYFTPTGNVWVAVENFGQRTRQTHFLSATPAEPVTTVDTAEDAEARKLRDRAVALAMPIEPGSDAEKTAAPELRVSDGLGIRTRTAAPKPTEANPYEGYSTHVFEGRTWARTEEGNVWFHQLTEHGPRHVLRFHQNRADAKGWYLSGPGINGDTFMAARITVAAHRANGRLDDVAELDGSTEQAVVDDAVKHGIRTRTAAPKPRPAFDQPFGPYTGRATQTFGNRTWGCGVTGQMWFHQRTEHGPRHVLRVYLGRARANGWYLSGPGINGDTFLAGTLTVAARRADVLLDDVAELTDAMEQVIVDWPKGQRVQGLDNYGVTCIGTVNGVAWGAVTDPGHDNYGRTWVDVDWDEYSHNRGTGRRSRPFTSDLIKH